MCDGILTGDDLPSTWGSGKARPRSGLPRVERGTRAPLSRSQHSNALSASPSSQVLPGCLSGQPEPTSNHRSPSLLLARSPASRRLGGLLVSYEISGPLRGPLSRLECLFGECTCLIASFRASLRTRRQRRVPVALSLISSRELCELKGFGDFALISARMSVDRAI